MEKLQIAQHKNGRYGLTYTYEEKTGSRLEWDGENRQEQVAQFEEHTDWVLPPDYDQVDALDIFGLYHVAIYGQHGLFLFQYTQAGMGAQKEPPPVHWKRILYEKSFESSDAFGAKRISAGFLIEPICPSVIVRKIAKSALYQVEAQANNNIMTDTGLFLLEGINEEIVQVSADKFVAKASPFFSLYLVRARERGSELQLLVHEEKWGKFYKEAHKQMVAATELDKLEARWKVSKGMLGGLFG